MTCPRFSCYSGRETRPWRSRGSLLKRAIFNRNLGPRASATQDSPPRALVVDVDDTLLRTDLFFEQVVDFFRSRPGRTPAMLNATWRGRLALKSFFAGCVPFDPAILPYREAVIDLMWRARRGGRLVILASASHRALVERVAAHVGCVDLVLASDADENLKGAFKLRRLRELLGDAPFTYVGDSSVDLPLWAAATEAVAVNPGRKARRLLRSRDIPYQTLADAPRAGLRPAVLLLQQLRWRAWVGVFAACAVAAFALGAGASATWEVAGAAFVGLSSAYSLLGLLRDLSGLARVRGDRERRSHPLAAGDLKLKTCLALVPFLLGTALAALLLAYHLRGAAW